MTRRAWLSLVAMLPFVKLVEIKPQTEELWAVWTQFPNSEINFCGYFTREELMGAPIEVPE